MPYDENLADRFRDMIEGLPGISEKRMMGGVCFLLNGNMVGGAGVSGSGERRFMFRVGKANADLASKIPGGEPMIHGGKRMSGLFYVNADDQPQSVIREWVALAVRNAQTLPPK